MEDAVIRIRVILTDAALAAVLEGIANKSAQLLESEPEAHYETLKPRHANLGGMLELARRLNAPHAAPAILVPKVGHTIRGPNGIVSRSMSGFENARDVLARDVRELRRVYPDIPTSTLQRLVEMNKQMYPDLAKATRP